MAVLHISGVVRDGSGDMAAAAQRIVWPRAEDGEIVLDLVKADGSVFDPTNHAITLTVRPSKSSIGNANGTALMSRQSTTVDASLGRVKFTVVAQDTITWQERRTFRFDVIVADVSGNRVQALPESDWRLDPIVGIPGDVATVIAPADPPVFGDHMVAADDTDTGFGFLLDKLDPGTGITLSVVTVSGIKKVRITSSGGASMPPIGPTNLFGVTASGVTPIYSTKLDLLSQPNASIDIYWGGTLAGALTLQYTNKPTPDETGDADWKPHETELVQPNGQAGGDSLDLTDFPFRYARLKLTPTAGSGLIDAWAIGKGA